MKRLFLLILSASMLLSLSACSLIAETPEPEFTLGTVNGNVYENIFIGIGCTLGSEWTFASDEQIKVQNGVSADLAGEEFRELMENSSVIYDMLATHSNQINSLVVNLEKVDKVQLAVVDLGEYLENSVPSIKQGLRNMGFTNITHNIGSVKLGEKDVTCLNVIAEFGDSKMYQTIVAIKCNGYLACVTFSANSQEAINDAIACFYWLE